MISSKDLVHIYIYIYIYIGPSHHAENVKHPSASVIGTPCRWGRGAISALLPV